MFGLITPDEFLDEILDKKQTSLFYNDTLPFTELSLGALDLYEDQYMNVYQKGALIGLCLDLLLLKDSNGEYDVRMLMNDLASMYGINKSFKDDELFDIITAISYPNTREFFKKYVEGKEALPLKEYLEFVGVNYLPGEVVSINSLGNIGIGFDPDKNQIIIADAGSNKGYGRKIGLEDGDVLLKMLGKDVTMDNYRMVFQSYFSLAAGAKFYMDVERVNKRGKVIHKRLKGKVLQVETVIGERLQWEENPTYMQITLRRSWINEHQY
jgi:predicted metalloprotease with PDZ domain